jgi:hypothetical protein
MRSGKGIARAIVAAVCLLDACGGGVALQADNADGGGADASDSSIPPQEGGTAPDATPDAGPDSPEAAADVTIGDTGIDAFDAPPDVAFDAAAALALCDAVYGSVLQPFEGCCSATDKQNAQYGDTVTLIQNFTANQCGGDLGTSLAKGRIAIDPALTAQCVADQATFFASTPPCWQIIDDPSSQSYVFLFGRPSCASALTGLQGVGAPCAYDYECQNGLTCIGWNNGVDGVCRVPPTTAGAACSWSGTSNYNPDYQFGTHPLCGDGFGCAAGETCQPLNGLGQNCSNWVGCVDGSICTGTVCQAGGPLPSGDGGPCASPSDCQLGLLCIAGDGGANACTPQLAPGAPCQFNSYCQGLCDTEAGACISFCNGP